ncbi:MAG: hypothetical protein ABGY41_14270, partial [Candidatus Poribacteria bacterium]
MAPSNEAHATRDPSRLTSTLVVLAFACLMLAVTAEVVVRTFHAVKHRDVVFLWKAPVYWNLYAADARLGWVPTPNMSYDWEPETIAGESYPVAYRTNADGMRPPVLDTSRPNLVVVGDSFTQAAQTDGGDTYYRVVAEALGYDVFAFGAGGYGSLQQYLALGDLVARYSPELVLWQVCS